jgi:hypothetical protein
VVVSDNWGFPGQNCILEFELKLFLIIASFLINELNFYVRNISGCQVELIVGFSSLDSPYEPPLTLVLDMLIWGFDVRCWFQEMRRLVYFFLFEHEVYYGRISYSKWYFEKLQLVHTSVWAACAVSHMISLSLILILGCSDELCGAHSMPICW